MGWVTQPATVHTIALCSSSSSSSGTRSDRDQILFRVVVGTYHGLAWGEEPEIGGADVNCVVVQSTVKLVDKNG